MAVGSIAWRGGSVLWVVECPQLPHVQDRAGRLAGSRAVLQALSLSQWTEGLSPPNLPTERTFLTSTAMWQQQGVGVFSATRGLLGKPKAESFPSAVW